MGQSVTLGGLPLMVDGTDYESPDGYVLTITGDETTLGKAESVISALYSMLSNGTLVARERDNNRSPSFIVEVSCPTDDGLALARGEKALRAVCKRPVPLVWTPPQAGAPVAVFDAVDSDMELIYSDMDETSQLRGYRITLSALPYGRSAALTVTPAIVSGGSGFITVNNADALTGWYAADPSDAGTDLGTSLRFVSSTGVPSTNVAYLHAAAILDPLPSDIATSGTFIVVEWRADNLRPDGVLKMDTQYTTGPPTWFAAGKIAEISLDADWKRTYFRPTGTNARFRFDAGPFFNVGAGYNLEIRDVSKTSTPPTVGTGKQQLAVINAGGSETTQGSIDIQHPTTPLGQMLLYTRPRDGTAYVPPLSPFAQGAGIADAAAVSGQHWVGDTGNPGFIIPNGGLPEGEYALVARVRRTDSTAPFPTRIDVWSHLGGSLSTGRVANVTLPDVWLSTPVNTYVMRSLGVLNLPLTKMGPHGYTYIFLKSMTIPTVIHWDEVWLCKTDGSLTIVDPVESAFAAAVDRRRIQLVAPSLEEPTGAIWSSNDDDMSTRTSLTDVCLSRQHHDLEPGENMVYAMTSGVTLPAISATHYNRWNTYPSD